MALYIITLTKMYNHITTVLMDLHWLLSLNGLNIQSYCLLIRHYKEQEYRQEWLVMSNSGRSLHSNEQSLLHVPKTRLVRYGYQSFQFAAPYLWNKMPLDLRQANSVHSLKSKLNIPL